MGSTYAAGLADAVDEAHCSLDNALRIHLQSNHYPPLPVELVDACQRAIRNIEAGDDRRLVQLPRGMKIRWYGAFTSRPPSWRIAEACHLDAFSSRRMRRI